MSGSAWLQVGVLVGLVFAGTRLLGPYLARVYGDGGAPGDRVFAPVERVLYRLGGVDPQREQPWTRVHALAVGVQRRLRDRPLFPPAPAGRAATEPDRCRVRSPPALAFNTAVSFVTNTNWQNYGGEATMSHLTQMAGLTVQNFVSAAVGISVAVALIRGLEPPAERDDRELLGRPGAHDDACPPAALASPSRCCSRARASSRSLARPCDGDHARGHDAGDLPRPGREPGGDQGAGDERRRHRQRELGAPVREPLRVHEPRPDAGRCC